MPGSCSTSSVGQGLRARERGWEGLAGCWRGACGRAAVGRGIGCRAGLGTSGGWLAAGAPGARLLQTLRSPEMPYQRFRPLRCPRQRQARQRRALRDSRLGGRAHCFPTFRDASGWCRCCVWEQRLGPVSMHGEAGTLAALAALAGPAADRPSAACRESYVHQRSGRALPPCTVRDGAARSFCSPSPASPGLQWLRTLIPRRQTSGMPLPGLPLAAAAAATAACRLPPLTPRCSPPLCSRLFAARTVCCWPKHTLSCSSSRLQVAAAVLRHLPSGRRPAQRGAAAAAQAAGPGHSCRARHRRRPRSGPERRQGAGGGAGCG